MASGLTWKNTGRLDDAAHLSHLRIDRHAPAEELGDFVLQAVFHARMAEEQELFSIGDALDAINAKLVRRHPHVFGGKKLSTSEEVMREYPKIKAKEKKH